MKCELELVWKKKKKERKHGISLRGVFLVTRRVFSRVTIFCTRSSLSLSFSSTFFFSSLFSGSSFTSRAKYDPWHVRRVQFHHRSRLGTLTCFLGPNMGLDSSRWGTQVHQLRSFRSRYYTEQWIVKISLLPSHRGCARFDAFLFRLYLFSRDIENFPV